jgi:hypothetical protein
MAAPTCQSSLFMGDCLADQEYEFEVYYDAIYSSTISFQKGSWFANAWVFWAWMANQIGSGDAEPRLYMGGPYDDRLTQQMLVGLLDNLYTVTCVTGNGGTFLDEIGYTDYGTYGDVFVPNATWHTTYPISQWDRGVASLDGSTTRGQDGTNYSIRGLTQGTRRVSVLLDQTITEQYDRNCWLNIWRKRWRVGRAVSCWPLFADELTNGTYTDTAAGPDYDPSQFGRFEILVCTPSAEEHWKTRRLVEAKNSVAIQDEYDFFIRQDVPLDVTIKPQTYRIM